ncbi:hypothetical protein [Ilumatobacter sp.]|uniref:hypothetical protein n=1 Tax=Ilumatobacter sp. TaxID=1967498 RepID=UPI003C32BFC7
MNNTVTPIERIETPGAQQLTLLTVPENPSTDLQPSSAHVRFQLSTTTRKRGLAHVAEIRRQLAESQEQREARVANPLPPRRPHAA